MAMHHRTNKRLVRYEISSFGRPKIVCRGLRRTKFLAKQCYARGLRILIDRVIKTDDSYETARIFRGPDQDAFDDIGLFAKRM